MTVPWMAPDLFPAKPAESEYGFAVGPRAVGCSQADLAARCGDRKQSPVWLVWIPESHRLVPPCEVPFLHQALLESALGRTRQGLAVALFSSAFFGLAYFVPLLMSRRAFPGMLLLFCILGAIPVIEGLLALRHLRGDAAGVMARESAVVRYASWLYGRKLQVTWMLAGILIGLQLLQFLVGGDASIRAAGLMKPAVREGEWWRLFTAPLLHGGLFHILFNGMALFSLGRSIEGLGDRSLAAAVFVVSALAGGVASVVFLPDAASVGASGGLMGYLGFLAVLGMRRKAELPREYVKSIVFSLVMIAAVGIAVWNRIDNAAHAGGLLAGMVFGALRIPREGPFPLASGPILRAVGALSVAVLAASAVGTGVAILR